MQENTAPKSGNQLVGVGIIAQLFGLTERRVQQLTQEGVISAVKEGRYNKYDILRTVQRYISYLQTKADEKEGSRDKDVELRALEAEISLKKSKASMAALELKEMEAMMHRSEDMQAMTEDLILLIELRIKELPNKLAQIHTVKTAAEASQIIKEEVFTILRDLANYQYDPAVYERHKAACNKPNGEHNAGKGA